MEKRKKILLIDDDRDLHFICRKYIESAGYQFLSAFNGKEGLEKILSEPVDLILLDFMMPEMDGFEVYKELVSNKRFKKYRHIPVIMLTVVSEDFLRQKQAISLGVSLYLKKPFGYRELINVIENVLLTTPIQVSQKRSYQQSIKKVERLADENFLLRSQIQQTYRLDNMIGTNPLMKQIFEKVIKVAKTDANIFIYGESGTGKELIAKNIHNYSRRSHKAFIPVDCVALPPNLLESELFGYEKGAFTGATSAKAGLLELAHQGTFFLDEICELSYDMQAKLLRVLQERQFRRVGGKKLIDVDIRIISASNQNPETAVAKNRLREDLYYRLNVIPIHLPPLRERRDDIPLLVQHFVRKFCLLNQRELIKISPEAMEYLIKYQWPGNVRELQNVVERIVSLASNSYITPDQLPEQVLNNSGRHLYPTIANVSLKEAKKMWLEKFERTYLSDLLLKCKGNISEVARQAQTNRMTIYRMIKNYEIPTKAFARR